MSKLLKKVAVCICIGLMLAVFTTPAPATAYYLPTTVQCGWNGTLENIEFRPGSSLADLVVDAPPDFTFLQYSEGNTVGGGNTYAGNVSVALVFRASNGEIVIPRYVEDEMERCIASSNGFEFKNIRVK